MGLKSGSRDSGLDSDESDGDDEKATEASAENEQQENSQREQKQQSGSDGATASEETTTQRPTVDSLPYKLRRSSVNDEREQVPYFMRPSVIDAEDELKETLEERLGETVYKSDYREAAMVVAQRNPSLVAAVLREWGYDLDTS